MDGQKQNVIVAYDALQKWDAVKGEWVKDENNEGKTLKVGVLLQGRQEQLGRLLHRHPPCGAGR